MKKYILVLALMLVAGRAYATDQCANAAKVKSSAPINITTAGTTQLVAAGNSNIFICEWTLSLSSNDTVQFVYGSGTNCGTGQVALTGAYNLGSQAGFLPSGGSSASMVIVPPGNAFCAVGTGAGFSVQGVVTYVRE